MLASFVHFLSCLFLFSFFLCFQVVLYAHDCSYTDLRICARAFLIAQLHKPKMAEPVISESESCYTTRTTNMSGSTSSALEEMQSRGSESEAEDQGADRCLTLTVRLTCGTGVPRVFVR